MKFNQLNLQSAKSRKRVGRGISAGSGKTAGRGTKGQSSRSGGKVRPGFEGGQNPLIARLPKLRGFKAHRKPLAEITTGELSKIGKHAKVIDNYAVAKYKSAQSPFESIKVIYKGEIDSALTVKLQKASANSLKAIEKSGGKFEAVAAPQKPKQTEKKAKN